MEVFSQEFPYFEDSVAYYKEAMALGRLRVNDEVTPLEYRCRDGDVITHIVHRFGDAPRTPRNAASPSRDTGPSYSAAGGDGDGVGRGGNGEGSRWRKGE